MVSRLKISEIARQTGVSISSVSRVLAGKSNTSAEVRQLVMDCARSKGVLSDMSAGRLLFNQLTVFAPSRSFALRSDIYYYKIVQSIREAARPYDIYLSYCELEENNSDVALFVKKISDPRCEAAIFLGIDDPKVHEIAADMGKICALVNCRDRAMRLDAVCPDHRAIGEHAARYLLEQGHRDSLMLICQRRSTMTRRLEGVRDAYEECRIPFDESRVLTTSGFSAEESAEAVTHYFNEQPIERRPTAILAWGDFMAVGAHKALNQLGLNVPNDVSLMSMDGQNLADIHDVPLSAIQIPRDELGQETLRLMQQRRLRPELPCCTLLLGGQLVERDSVKPLGGRRLKTANSSRKYSLYGE